MTTTAGGSDPTPRRWRVRGLESNRRFGFVVAKAQTSVGFLESSDVVLRVAGVSRRHAVLHWSPEGLGVTDLGSRNGTLVNAERVTHRQLAPGDEVQFGPVRLVVEVIDHDDADLALTVDGLDPLSGQDTEWQPHVAAERDGTGIATTLLPLLRPEGPAVVEAFARLAEQAGAAGGAFGEWPGTGEPSLLATAGDVGTNMEHPSLYEFFASVHAKGENAPCWDTTVIAADPPLSCGALRAPGTWLLGVVLRGKTLRRDWRESVEVFLRIVDQARFRAVSPGRPRLPTASGSLPFPLSFVRGVSSAMNLVYQQIQRLRDGEFPVLVVGETGVGKEHLVRLIHESSRRRSGPFVAVNCSAVPAELLEAEMFGIGRGVASGVQERVGRFQEAAGGTLFLDEIGEMPLALQAKLLRALESRVVLPLGCAPVDVDVRIVAATNADLRARIATGAFRADLYYRLEGYELRVPPLRERIEDMPSLIQHFLGSLCTRMGKRVAGLTVGAMKLLLAYPWPGNVRELENEVRRLVLCCPDGQPIDSSMVHPIVRQASGSTTVELPSTNLTLEQAVAELEERMIRQALQRLHGNRSGVARLLGLSRNGLAAKMQRLGIEDARS